MENKNTFFEVVKLILDDEQEISDSKTIESFDDYNCALEFAKSQKININDNEQIAIWETGKDTFDCVDSWVVLPESEAD